MDIRVEIKSNRLPEMRRQFPADVNRLVREQILVTEADIKVNIVKYDAIDTGNMLGSVRGEMTGQFSGEVSVSAQSGDGYPYPMAVNYGTRFMPARPFADDAAIKAEKEFPERFRRMGLL